MILKKIIKTRFKFFYIYFYFQIFPFSLSKYPEIPLIPVRGGGGETIEPNTQITDLKTEK